MGMFIESLLTLVDGLLILLAFIYLNNIAGFLKENKLKCFIFILTYIVFTIWLSSFVSFSLHTLMIILFTAIVLGFITKIGFITSIISVASIFIVFFPVELAVITIVSITFDFNVNELTTMGSMRYILGFFSKGIQLILIFLLKKFNLNFRKFSKPSKTNNIYSILILQALVLSLLFFTFSIISLKDHNLSSYIFYLPAIYVLFLVLTILDLKERTRLQSIQYKLQAQEERIQNLETIMNIIRREKHDFSNHLNTLLALCVLNKPDALSKIESYIKKITSNLQSSYHMYNTGNDYVDGLLAVKSNIAFQKNITFEVQFECSLQDFKVNDCDLTSILSNILDNAFDAILMSDDVEKKVISICSYEEDNNKILSVANNGPVIQPQDIPKLFLNGYSSKNKESGERGFGLYIVKELVDKYGGEIVVTSIEGETEFLITFKEVE